MAQMSSFENIKYSGKIGLITTSPEKAQQRDYSPHHEYAYRFQSFVNTLKGRDLKKNTLKGEYG